MTPQTWHPIQRLAVCMEGLLRIRIKTETQTSVRVELEMRPRVLVHMPRTHNGGARDGNRQQVIIVRRLQPQSLRKVALERPSETRRPSMPKVAPERPFRAARPQVRTWEIKDLTTATLGQSSPQSATPAGAGHVSGRPHMRQPSATSEKRIR